MGNSVSRQSVKMLYQPTYLEYALIFVSVHSSRECASECLPFVPKKPIAV